MVKEAWPRLFVFHKQLAFVNKRLLLVTALFGVWILWLSGLLLYICITVVIVFSSSNSPEIIELAVKRLHPAQLQHWNLIFHVDLVTDGTGTLSCIFSKFILRFDLKGWKFKGTAAEWLLESSTMYNQHQWGLHIKSSLKSHFFVAALKRPFMSHRSSICLRRVAFTLQVK